MTSTQAAARRVFPDAEWQVKDPEELGMDRSRLDAFRSAIGGSGPGCVVTGTTAGKN